MSLIAAPVVAAEAAPNAPISSDSRAGATVAGQSDLAGGGWLIAIPAFVAVALGVYFGTKSNKKKPISS